MAYLRIDQINASTFGLHSKGRRQRMGRAAALIVNKWKQKARTLGKTAQAYSMSIQIAKVTDTECIVELPGKNTSGRNALIARIIEFGMGPGGIGTFGPYDVRQFLLRNSRSGTKPVRISKDGHPYRIVNFDLSQQALLEAQGGKDAMAVFKASNQRGERVFSTDVTKQRTAWGARLSPSMGQKLKPHHVSTQLGGGVAFGAEKGASGIMEMTRFSTFRTASMKNTNPMAWRSKGVQPRRFAEQVQREIREQLLKVI